METLDDLVEDYMEIINIEEPLELAFTMNNNEFETSNGEAFGYEKLRDTHPLLMEGACLMDLEKLALMKKKMMKLAMVSLANMTIGVSSKHYKWSLNLYQMG